MSVDYRPEYDPADVNSDYGHTGGDITVPTFTANMKPFRFWCQKALPLVYDDSLSYYEVLCKMADYMNNFLTDLTTVEDSMTEFGQQFVLNQQFLNSMAEQLGQNVEDLETYINERMSDFMEAYTQLQTYVNTYFDNLDVQTQINNKLDEMAEDGTFNTLFDPVITTWMTTKTAQIDSAIAQQDAIQAQQNARISVLESRMDTFSGLPSGSTSGNAELLDIRTNFLGETYPNAGDAVRASDMIASGFQSISATKLEEWDGNDDSSTYDTIQIDIGGYKGGHVVVIGSFKFFQQDIQELGRCSVYATNTPGKVEDSQAVNCFPGGTNSIFTNFTQLTTNISGEERLLLQFAIPDDYAYQYLKIGHFEHSPLSGSYTEPLYIVYANSWSKTPVDPTLTIAGAAADAKAAGDAIDELNERIDNVESETEAQADKNASMFAPLYDGISYTGNPVVLSVNQDAVITVNSNADGQVFICGKNFFDDSYMKTLGTDNEHIFYGMGADFSALPVYALNNICENIIFSASVRPESDLAMEMALNIMYTDGTSRKEYFYNFSDASTWVRKSINIYRSDKTVASVSIICTKNTASKVFVKDIMLEKATTVTVFEAFSGEKVTAESGLDINAFASNGVNTVFSPVADAVLSVKVLNESLPEKNQSDIASMKNDLYSLAVTDSVNTEGNRAVTSGTWGLIPTKSAEKLVVNPSFDITTGTYTISHYALTGSDQSAILIDTTSYNIGESAEFLNVTPQDYFVISASGGQLNYRNDSAQTILTKFAYLSSGKAVDYANSQIAGLVEMWNMIPVTSEKQFTGKTIVFFGDSRTWYDGKAYTAGTKPEWTGKICKGYQQTVSDLTGCITINKGFSGYTSSQICEQIRAYDFSSVDAVYLSGGVNDFIKQDEISTGTIQPIGSTFDTTTSYGAWQSAIEYLLTNYPQLKIYIDTPWVCWNWYGNILPESIAEVKKNVAELYSIECLDMYHISGINLVNRDYFFVDDLSGNGQSRLHMNDYGNEWLGSIIGKFLLSY